MAATRLIAMHMQKARSIQQCIKDRTDYAKNGEKTDDGEYISAYECDAKTVDKEFAVSKNEYEINTGRHPKKNDIIAYQIRQSFKPGEVNPEEANKIGYETAMRFTKGKHAFIVATHVDKAHIHNHIIFNSTDLTERRKFNNFFFSGIALQKVSDLVCLEHGLSVIKPLKPGERTKRTIYPKEKSFREEIRDAIDAAMKKSPKDMDELLRFLEEAGYEIKRGKYCAVKSKEQKSFIRFRSLGAGYREADLEKVFAGGSKHEVNPAQMGASDTQRKTEKKIDMLLDIQAMIAKGKGPGYERWAKVHNIKQMSQTLLFLQERGIRDYAELAERASASSKRFGELSAEIKEAEKRLAEIAVLKTHIINYSKTKDVYVAYRKSGYSKSFFEAHREEITLHKAAKDAFSQIEGSIPKIKDLNEEYAKVLKKKKNAYTEYRQTKEEMKEFQTAKYNVDQFLRRNEEQQEQERKKHRNKTL